MPVAPPVICGKQVTQRRQEVVVGTGAGLDDRDPGCRVRDEQVQETVTALAGATRSSLTLSTSSSWVGLLVEVRATVVEDGYPLGVVTSPRTAKVS